MVANDMKKETILHHLGDQLHLSLSYFRGRSFALAILAQITISC